MNTDTKELVKKVFGNYALMIRKAHGHWAFSDEELEQFVNMIRADEREACASLVSPQFQEARDTEFDLGFETARKVFAASIRSRQ